MAARRTASGSSGTTALTWDSQNIGAVINTERVIRLEVQRREIKEHMQVNDVLIKDIDTQLASIAEFKKEWLKRHKLLESDRKVIVLKEDAARKQLVEQSRVHWDGIMYNFMRPLIRLQNGDPPQ